MTVRSRRTFLAKEEQQRVETFLMKTRKNDTGRKWTRSRGYLAFVVLMVGLLGASYSMFSVPITSDRHLAVENENEARTPEEPPSPFSSSPPPDIPLNPNDGHLGTRHSCIRSIRKRHDISLRKFIDASSTVLLVDPAYHSNVGDHMITLGELTFIENENTTKGAPGAHQCSYIQAGSYAPPCQETIASLSNKPSTPMLAMWHGGGNWGTLWPRAQEPRVQSFRTLLDAGYTVITMPNSWYYDDDASETKEVERIRDSLMEGISSNNKSAVLSERVVFTWREQYSYDKAQQNFPFVTNLLVPDIAFQLGPYRASQVPDVDLLLLLRDDHESLFKAERNRLHFRQLLDSVPGAKDLSFSIVDWGDRLHRFGSNDIFFTETAVDLLGLGRVVICDRLHAAILAYLSGMPFIYLDQVSGKITKTLSVAMDIENCSPDETWQRANNLTEAVSLGMRLLEQSTAKRPSRHERRNRLRHQLNQERTPIN